MLVKYFIHLQVEIMRTLFWCESQKEGDHYTDLDIGGRIILKLILEEWDAVVWTRFIWLRIGTNRGLL
jgi:hypothetical protein